MTLKKILSGTAVAFLLTAGAAAAQTTTPEIPDTGVGGSAAINIALLAGSAAVALAGAFMLYRRRDV